MLWYLGFTCLLQACVAGMFEYRDFGAFKQHLRDFLVQVLDLEKRNSMQPVACAHGGLGISPQAASWHPALLSR